MSVNKEDSFIFHLSLSHRWKRPYHECLLLFRHLNQPKHVILDVQYMNPKWYFMIQCRLYSSWHLLPRTYVTYMKTGSLINNNSLYLMFTIEQIIPSFPFFSICPMSGSAILRPSLANFVCSKYITKMKNAKLMRFHFSKPTKINWI